MKRYVLTILTPLILKIANLIKFYLTTINENKRTVYETSIRELECFKAIFQLVNNKSPGLNVFCRVLKNPLAILQKLVPKCLNYTFSLQARFLILDPNEGVITLLINLKKSACKFDL